MRWHFVCVRVFNARIHFSMSDERAAAAAHFPLLIPFFFHSWFFVVVGIFQIRRSFARMRSSSSRRYKFDKQWFCLIYRPPVFLCLLFGIEHASKTLRDGRTKLFHHHDSRLIMKVQELKKWYIGRRKDVKEEKLNVHRLLSVTTSSLDCHAHQADEDMKMR